MSFSFLKNKYEDIILVKFRTGNTVNFRLFLDVRNTFGFIVSQPTLDEAAEGVTKTMARYLVERSSLSLSDATMLLSAAGDVQVSQIVDPYKTARMFVPKEILSQLGITEVF